ncbi:hypothetical protein P8631_11690 [Guyparkeria sp. 1SP6A2]|nr:hypothetical protein [Guyparkeria sp. 1SP6A2]
MSEFDPHFEPFRLNFLLRQHPEVADMKGEVVFASEQEEDRISGATWSFDGDYFAYFRDSGFKLKLMELLDQLIQYRAMHRASPWKEGIAWLRDGKLSIEWLEHGSTHLTNPDLEYRPADEGTDR